MDIRQLFFGKELAVHVAVASRIYWSILEPEERRWLKKRDEMVEYCSLRIARELGEEVRGEDARRKFLRSVRCVMDNIHRKAKERQYYKSHGLPLPTLEQRKLAYERPPQQLHLEL